jgi:cation diffusion facilitator family transporter
MAKILHVGETIEGRHHPDGMMPATGKPEAAREKTRAARLAIASNVTLVIVKLAAGLATGSVSVFSEAIHSTVDLVASAVAFLSVRASDAPADAEHPYGHGKVENLSAVAEALLIFGAAAFILFNAIERALRHTAVERLDLAMGVMLFSALANFFVSGRLLRVAQATDSVALAADAWHLRVDLYTSVAVLLGLLLVRFTGWSVVDPVIGVAVALLIVRTAIQLVHEAGGPLLDRLLPAEEIARLQDILDADQRVVGYHKVRARKSGSQRHIDLHLLVDQEMSLRDAHRLAEEVEDRIREEFGQSGVHIITHVEPATEEELAVKEEDPGIQKGTPRADAEPPGSL